jgi:signal transduction histidine kinase
MFFGGSNGFNAFFPEDIIDDPFVPPVAITSFKIFNKTVPVGAESVLKKAIPYVDSLTLSYKDNVFSFEFAGLSYANSQKNRYRYKLERLEPSWNEVGSKQRLATYTNLDPGKYVFRVQGSNSDGVWNEAGVSLPILITPSWWGTTWFRAVCAILFMALLWAAYQLRLRQLHHQFEMALAARVGERTRIARELHDTLLQKFQGLLPRVQAAIYKLPSGAFESRKILEAANDLASEAITEGRDAVQGLRLSTVEENDIAVAIRTIGDLAAAGNQSSPAFEVVAQGSPRSLHLIVRDEVYRIAAEALRNAFQHARAHQIEVEIGYGEKDFTIHIRDDGKGIDREVLSADGREGHFGLHGMRERAELVGGKLVVWSELEAGSEVELSIPASRAYIDSPRRLWRFPKLSKKDTDRNQKSNA